MSGALHASEVSPVEVGAARAAGGPVASESLEVPEFTGEVRIVDAVAMPDRLLPRLVELSHERAASDNNEKTLVSQVDAVNNFVRSLYRGDSVPLTPQNTGDLRDMVHLLGVLDADASYLEAQVGYSGAGIAAIKTYIHELKGSLEMILSAGVTVPAGGAPLYRDFLGLKKLIHKIQTSNYISWRSMIVQEFPRIHTVAPVAVGEGGGADHRRLARFARNYTDVHDETMVAERRKSDEKYQTVSRTLPDGREMKEYRSDLREIGIFKAYFFMPAEGVAAKGVILDYYGGHTTKDDTPLRMRMEKVKPYNDAGFIYVVLRTEDIHHDTHQRKQFVTTEGKALLVKTLETAIKFSLHVRERWPGLPLYYKGTSFGAAKGAMLNAIQSSAVDAISGVESGEGFAAAGGRGGVGLSRVGEALRERLTPAVRSELLEVLERIGRVTPGQLAKLFDGYLFFSGGLKFAVGGEKYTRTGNGPITPIAVEQTLGVSPTRVPVFIAHNADDERAPIQDAVKYRDMISMGTDSPVWLHVTPQGAASPVQEVSGVATSAMGHGLPRSQLLRENLIYRVLQFLRNRGAMSEFERARMQRHLEHTTRILAVGTPRTPRPGDASRAGGSAEVSDFDESFNASYILRR